MLAALLTLLAAALAAPPVAAEDAVAMAEETYHHLTLETPLVALYDVVLPPGARMRTHRHPAHHFAVVLEPGTLRNEVVGQPITERFTGPAGTFVDLPPGPPHRQSNVGPAPVHFLGAEILGPAPAGTEVDTKTAVPGCEVVADNPTFAAWRCRVPPAATLALRHEGPFLRIVVQSPGPPGTELAPGQATWHETGGSGAVRNAGPGPLDLIEIAWRAAP